MTLGVSQAHGGQDEWSQEGESDLTAVGVAGEHQIDERAAGVDANLVGVVGLMRHQDNGAIGIGGDGEVEVWMAGTGIVDAAEPEAAAVALDGHVLVDQYGSAVSGEGADYGAGVECHVMVAEDAVSERSSEGGQYLGAAVEGVVSGDEGEGAVGDEISGKEHEIGVLGVDLTDDPFEEVGLGVLVEVDVADLGDAITVEGVREVSDGDGAVYDVDLVACDFAGVQGESGGGDARTREEASAGEA